MRIWYWLFVGLLGFLLMLAAYIKREKPDPEAGWAYGFIAIGPAPDAGGPGLGQTTAMRLRLLPANARTEALLKTATGALAASAANLEAQLRPKLIVLPLQASGIDASSLQSGRLPVPGAPEVIAGPDTDESNRVVVGDRTLEVVGRLRSADYGAFANSFLMSPSDATKDLLPEDDHSVHPATAVPLTLEQARDRKLVEERAKTFPAPKYTVIASSGRLDARSYYLYLAGLAIMLVGGSGALIWLYRLGAQWSQRHGLAGNDGVVDEWREPGETSAAPKRQRPNWLVAPLLELQKRPRLVWGVHLAYFGLVILGAILIHEFPDVQAFFLSIVGKALSDSKGPLGAAGHAYASGNIPYAALVTFGVNFFLGSLACITIPSILVPGSGTLLAVVRSLLWGVILAPTFVLLAGSMLPHSLTMLLEGEGYILATIFGLLIPIHIVQSSLGGNPLTRFGRVLLLNLQALVLVALVLGVAACYEATEVILMNRH
jgi:hypothetical protein